MRLTTGFLGLALAIAAVLRPPRRTRCAVDLTSPGMTTAEMTRGQVEEALKAPPAGHGADFNRKRLSGLDLSGLDLSGADFRAARLNHANLRAQSSTGRPWTRRGRLVSISLEPASSRQACSRRRWRARISTAPTLPGRA